MICSAQTALKQIRLRLAPSSSRRCYSAGRGMDAKVSNVPSDEERKAEHIRISKQIQSEAQHGDEKKAPLRMEELNPFYWTVSSGPGWSGARSRVDEKEQSRFYKLSFKDRSNPSIGAQVQTLMEITDPVLFCTAPQNEIDLEELGSTVVDWDDLESMISKGATHRPVAVTTTVEAMLGDVKVDDAFSPTEELEKIISDAFSDITVPVNFTAAALPSDQVEFDGIEEVTLRDQLRGRNLATINAIYERAGFPYRWYSETDMELQDALKYLRDVNGHIVDAGWSNADILLVEVDPTTSLIKQPLNIVMFIELKTPQVLNMIGQAIHAIRPRDHVLTGPRKKNSQQKRSSRTKGEKLITQIGFEFWASGASLAV
ncbi:uncharacterized protein EV420DRAFT_750878 [Desarmillaria tabescens]|uniref:Uncharacterized protein n=1 Tax=Armillaria tabescens TaxID=1929756 RepID=A0AA39JWZ7_ARMTA|nr:uncharacterized protein EV420DRAFT_750878 [Desarmillaria tabescens]KAK0450359.1 hypothetical protein EV420DRAFT_750878 [Desarmillaria tabescens]